ncbi:MAG: FAD-dependent oxidoreductase [Melioribacteraceae bacterium]|nr:FAD-dependent oxidoreductase [Melioribacteraceae bacterium]
MNFSDSGNIIVVGGNAAGSAAAAKAKRVNPKANVILFEATEFISTGTCELPYVLSGKIGDYNEIIFFTPEKFYHEKGVKVFNFHKVESINKRAKLVNVIDLKIGESKTFEYDKLILTTGSRPKEIENIPSTLDNVFTIKSVTDLIKIENYLTDNAVKKAAVFGAGYIGVEISEALKKLNLCVSLFDINEMPMADSEDEIQSIILNHIKSNGVEFYGKCENLQVYKENNRLTKIKADGYLKEFDVFFSTAGIEPNIDLAKSCKLEIGKLGGIKTDNRCKTSDPHIYAAGDCIEVKNKITNRPDYFPMATMAHAQGHVAGTNAAGGFNKLNPAIKNIAVKVFDKVYTSVGLKESEALKFNRNVKSVSAEIPNLVKVMPESSSVFAKIVYDDYSKNILGASFIGEKEVVGYADLISSLIYNKSSVESLAEMDFNYTPPMSPFINILSVLGRKIIRG